ncbi:MAG: GldG family protein [bacterium]
MSKGKLEKIGYSTHVFIYILIVLVIIIAINVISLAKFSRLDMTEDKRFSISETTKNIARDLDDLINIKVYFTKNLPPQLVDLQHNVQDMLDEYKAYARGNLQVEFIDPASDPELEQRMQFIGIPKVMLNVFEKDKAQVANVYLGMSVLYEDRKEAIPVIQNIDNLEYDLTSAILKVIRKEPKVVGFLTGHGERPLEDDYSNIKKMLEKQYEIREVDLKKDKEALEKIDTLIIAGAEKVSDRHKYLLDQYLMGGGKEIFLIDTVKLGEEGGLSANNVETDLLDMLRHYGVTIKSDLVLDRSNSRAAFSGGGFFHFQLPYPFWPKVRKDGFNKEQPMVSELESLTLPWTSSLKIEQASIERQGVSATILAKTTPHGWTQQGRYDLNPQQNFGLTAAGSREEIPLAVMLSGKFKSFYANKKIPPKEEEDSDKESTADESALKENHEDVQIIAIGNSRFIKDDFLGRFRENSIFFMNMVDWLTMGDKLIGIRSRETVDRPLKEISSSQMATIRYINIFGISILIIIFGLVRVYLKRKRRSYVYEF